MYQALPFCISVQERDPREQKGERHVQTPFTLVTSYSEVVDNVRQFNFDLPNDHGLQSQLSQFRHWYYVEELQSFGPSKFIGYRGMTGERYRNKKGMGADGRVTLYHLQTALHAALSEDDKLRAELETFLGAYNKKSNALSKIHIFTTTRIVRNNRSTPRPLNK